MMATGLPSPRAETLAKEDEADPPSTQLAPHLPLNPLTDLAGLPTLFPAPIAQLITTLSTSARLSLRLTAFFIEAILETSQYSTRVSLGYTRRLLITAISSARRVYLMGNAAMEGDLMSLMGFSEELAKPGSGNRGSGGLSTDAFLGVLDKYTNLGIYLIHHTFTLAELFAMSGFYLTANAVQSAHFAAQESVSLFDSLFGSTESSRTLSAIITMVRRELLDDERLEEERGGKVRGKGKGKKGKMSTVGGLTALTKAMTAFACLQGATWARTSERLKMKVLYDCTVLVEKDESFRSRKQVTVHNNLAPTPAPMLAPIQLIGDRSLAEAGPGPSTQAARERQRSQTPLEDVNDRLWAHISRPSLSQYPSDSSDPNSRHRDTRRSSLDELWDLEDLVGESGDEEYDGPPDDTARRQHRLKRMREETLEITDELTESTVITQMLERVHADGRTESRPWQGRHLRRKSAPDTNNPMPDVAVEELDDDADPEIRVIRTALTSPRRRSSLAGGREEEGEGSEAEWIEVDQLLEPEVEEEFPSAPNGGSCIATTSYRDALDHPAANAERIQLVLKTMTNKLLQRRRTVRRVRTEEDQSVKAQGSAETMRKGRTDVRDIEWSRDASVATITPTRENKVPSAGSMTSLDGSVASSTPTPKSRRGRGKDQPSYPPSAYQASAENRGALSRDTSLSRGLSRAKSAITSLGKGKRRSSSRTASPTRTPPSPPHPHKADADRLPSAPPPTPYAPASRAPVASSSWRRKSRPAVAEVMTESVHTSSSRFQAAASQTVPEPRACRLESAVKDGGPGTEQEEVWPRDTLVGNIHRFMRYSSAAYGQNFLRILGLGNSEYNFPSTARHHANSWAFAQHTNMPIDSLLLSSYTDSSPFVNQKGPPLVHYVAVDHSLGAIVLTCRGTLGLSDVLIDLTCEYQDITVAGGDPHAHYFVHSGMWLSAKHLTAQQSTVHQTLVNALKRYPTYGLVVTGHSLGGGVAALLAIACSVPAKDYFDDQQQRQQQRPHRNLAGPENSSSNNTLFVTSKESGLPPGRPIHCYAYGPPAIASPDLARYARGLITSVIHGSDVVPTLSLGVLRDFKNVAVTLAEEGNMAEEIVGRVVGIYQRRFAFQRDSDDAKQSPPPFGGAGGASPDLPTDEQVLSDWMVSLVKTMRADMDSDKLLPPGRVYIMEYFDVFVTADEDDQGGKKITHKQAHRAVLRECESVEERFREPLFTKTMLNDHLPSHYERSTQLLFDGMTMGRP